METRRKSLLMSSKGRQPQIHRPDSFWEHGFIPGLKPRGHEALLSESPANQAAPDLDAASARDLREPPGPLEPPNESRPEPRSVQSRAIVQRNLRRLVAARPSVTAIQPCNTPQKELRALVLAILRHLSKEHCKLGQEVEFERWWAVVRVYRRVLCEKEMKEPGARAVLRDLLLLKADELTERKLEYVLRRRGRRASRG